MKYFQHKKESFPNNIENLTSAGFSIFQRFRRKPLVSTSKPINYKQTTAQLTAT